MVSDQESALLSSESRPPVFLWRRGRAGWGRADFPFKAEQAWKRGSRDLFPRELLGSSPYFSPIVALYYSELLVLPVPEHFENSSV